MGINIDKHAKFVTTNFCFFPPFRNIKFILIVTNLSWRNHISKAIQTFSNYKRKNKENNRKWHVGVWAVYVCMRRARIQHTRIDFYVSGRGRDRVNIEKSFCLSLCEIVYREKSVDFCWKKNPNIDESYIHENGILINFLERFFNGKHPAFFPTQFFVNLTFLFALQWRYWVIWIQKND